VTIINNGAGNWPAPYFFEPAMAIEGSTAVDCDALASDLERDVYCVLGLPIDELNMQATLRRIDAAVASGAAYFISTPNLNFLVTSWSNPQRVCTG
jgi:hypothetical protein